MKRMGLFKKLATVALVGVTALTSVVGCTFGTDPSGLSNSSVVPQSAKGVDYNSALETKLYTYSAVKPDLSGIDVQDTEQMRKKSAEFTNSLFEDMYVFVDPGAEGKFINDYVSSTSEVTFAELVKAEIDAFGLDLYTRLNFVYGDPTGRTNQDITSSLYGSNKYVSQPSKALVDDMGSEVSSYNLSDMSHVSWSDKLSPTTPDSTNPLQLWNSIAGNRYSITVDMESDPRTATEDGYIADSNYAWAYKAAFTRDEEDIIRLNIAEILAGYTLDELSDIYDPYAYTEACAMVNHLGFLTYDKNMIKRYILEKVIGSDALLLEREAEGALIQIAQSTTIKDVSLGNVTYNATTGDITVTGNLGFKADECISKLDTGDQSYLRYFLSGHNYKAYEDVVATIVENIVKEKFTEGKIDELVYTKLPRLQLLTMPLSMLDGSLTTTYDEDIDYTDIASAIHYNPAVKDLNIISIIFRTKDGIVKDFDVPDPEENEQYDEGINIISMDDLSFYSDNYGAEISVEFEGKASGVDIVDANGNTYGFTQAIMASTYPDGSSECSTYLVDEEKAKTEWVGNHFVGYDGVDLIEKLESFGVTGKEVKDGDTVLYTEYTLTARLNADPEDVVLGINDITVTNDDEIIYKFGYKLDSSIFGNNFLKVNLSFSNVTDNQNNNLDLTYIPVTILSIQIGVNCWQDQPTGADITRD
ncbi:MAG: hypothetical protein J6X00_00305 [Clostridia bacterium]|nr:hypothetical protein [Clostridia bacterium]